MQTNKETKCYREQLRRENDETKKAVGEDREREQDSDKKREVERRQKQRRKLKG